MAVKTLLGHVIIWCDKDDPFDTNKVNNIRDNDLKYWGEIEEIKPPVKEFSDGQTTDKCKWWDVKIITDIGESQVSAPHIASSRLALNKILNSEPGNISFRWKE